MVQRLCYRRRLSYNTRSNKVKIVKTPGGKLTYIHIKKRASVPRCGDCGHDLQGIPALRPRKYAIVSKRQKTINRSYGGSRCAACVRQRILRAFLIEEHKVVKKVMKSKKMTLGGGASAEKKPAAVSTPAGPSASTGKGNKPEASAVSSSFKAEKKSQLASTATTKAPGTKPQPQGMKKGLAGKKPTSSSK